MTIELQKFSQKTVRTLDLDEMSFFNVRRVIKYPCSIKYFFENVLDKKRLYKALNDIVTTYANYSILHFRGSSHARNKEFINLGGIRNKR